MSSTTTAESIANLADEVAVVGAARPVTEMLALDRAECMQLLAANEFGRVAVTVPGWADPMIRPVNYVFDAASNSVLIRSAPGAKLHALLRSSTAAFEIDGADLERRLGWSVIIHGVSEEITDRAELRRLGGGASDPVAPGQKDHWIRIRARTVSGRRIRVFPSP